MQKLFSKKSQKRRCEGALRELENARSEYDAAQKISDECQAADCSTVLNICTDAKRRVDAKYWSWSICTGRPQPRRISNSLIVCSPPPKFLSEPVSSEPVSSEPEKGNDSLFISGVALLVGVLGITVLVLLRSRKRFSKDSHIPM